MKWSQKELPTVTISDYDFHETNLGKYIFFHDWVRLSEEDKLKVVTQLMEREDLPDQDRMKIRSVLETKIRGNRSL